MAKRQISADYLFKFWKEHHFTIAVLADRMGASESNVRGCLKHSPNRLGRPMKFSAYNLRRLNAALEQIASELRGCIITFGSDKTHTNQLGNTYDPSTVDAINHLGTYFKIKGFMASVLGWNEAKRFSVLSVKSSRVYGNVTREDIDRINTELSSLAGVLMDMEVVDE